MIGRWPSGAPLMLAPDADQPELGSDLQRMNNFLYANDRRATPGPALPARRAYQAHESARHGASGA